VTRRLLAADNDLGPSELTPQASLVWLGQAGFLLRLPSADGGAGYTILIDPYLSDSLATKYAGKHFAHERLIAPPATVAELENVDLVLCSHKHADHMDPETLRDLASSQPHCRFIVPKAWREHAMDLGVPTDRLLGAEAGRAIEPAPGLRVTPVLAAHEQLEFDVLGHSRHLGYVIDDGYACIYHSGDCVPYPNQAATLRPFGIQVALLPINGRDQYRLEHGVPGNFHPSEAVDLAIGIGADVLVGHHFGLFAFNTVNEGDLQDALGRLPSSIQWLRPEPTRRFDLVEI
jgi:L-ascorbate metabolism protein UlaG (beta-lactamase superfamily)